MTIIQWELSEHGWCLQYNKYWITRYFDENYFPCYRDLFRTACPDKTVDWKCCSLKKKRKIILFLFHHTRKLLLLIMLIVCLPLDFNNKCAFIFVQRTPVRLFTLSSWGHSWQIFSLLLSLKKTTCRLVDRLCCSHHFNLLRFFLS